MLIDESARDSLHAAITVANQAHPVFTFTSFEKAKGKLEKLQRTGGKTNMQEALEKSLQMFQNPNSGARAESFRRVLVVTGGQSNRAYLIPEFVYVPQQTTGFTVKQSSTS